MKKIWEVCRIVFKHNPVFLVFNFFIVLFLSNVQLLMGIAFSRATDAALHHGGAHGWEWMLYLAFFCAAVCIGGNTYNFLELLGVRYTRYVNKVIVRSFLEKTQRSRQDRFYDKKYNDQYEFVKKNIDSAAKLAVAVMTHLSAALASLLFSVLYITAIDPLVVALLLLCSLSIFLMNRYIVSEQVKMERRYSNRRRQTEYYESLIKNKNHAMELRLLHAGDFFLGKWRDAYSSMQRAEYRYWKKHYLLSEGANLLRQFATCFILLYLLYRLACGQLTLSAFVLIYNVMWPVVYGISNIAEIITREIAQQYRYLCEYEAFTAPEEKENGRKEAPETFESLQLVDIGYRYPKQQNPAVGGISLTIKAGEKLCILGMNGSGKTTLSKIMCGLLEDYTGTLLLNGQDVRSLERASYFKLFGVAFQDFTRYSLSMRENIGFGDVGRMDDGQMVERAAQKANLGREIAKFKNGLDTVLGKEFDPDGQELSGGQWQKLALARAYAKEPQVLIMDEPTASVDALEEMEMLAHFGSVVRDNTAVLISHRIGFARLADRIILLEHGRIVEEGTHGQLLAKKGAYYKMYVSQKELYEKEGKKHAGLS